MRKLTHQEGSGLKILDRSTAWYGIGSCGVCGDSGSALVPLAVRFWDPDDGWKVGVLCTYCGEECSHRGPMPTDYAATPAMFQGQEITQQDCAALLDLDAALSAGDLDHMATDYLD